MPQVTHGDPPYVTDRCVTSLPFLNPHTTQHNPYRRAELITFLKSTHSDIIIYTFGLVLHLALPALDVSFRHHVAAECVRGGRCPDGL